MNAPLPPLRHRRVDLGFDVLDRIDLSTEDEIKAEVVGLADAHVVYDGEHGACFHPSRPTSGRHLRMRAVCEFHRLPEARQLIADAWEHFTAYPLHVSGISGNPHAIKHEIP